MSKPTYLQQLLNINLEKKIISESTLLTQMQDWLTSCDKDVLCQLAKDFFGGEYLPLGFIRNDGVYDECFEVNPDENYMGAFDKA